jgi:hypothetical protein
MSSATMDNLYQISRNLFQERIKKGLIGPGSDVFVHVEDINHEIISDYPLIRYFSGVLFPERTHPVTQSEMDDADMENETNDEEVDGDNDKVMQEEVDEMVETATNITNHRTSDADATQLSTNNFFPTNMGITFCVVDGTEKVEVEFSFGVYFPEKEDRRIRMPKEDFEKFVSNPAFSFKEIISYEDGYMILSRGLRGQSSYPRSEEYEELDEFKKREDFKDSELAKVFHSFESLTRRIWRRRPVLIKETIPLVEGRCDNIFQHQVSKSHLVSVGYRVKTYKNEDKNPGRRYVKIQLVNTSSEHPANKFNNKNTLLNQKCLFQSTIKVYSDTFKPYRSYQDLNPYDEEGQRLDYLYRSVNSFGIGHNCAFMWDTENESPEWLTSTFLPEYDVRDTLNKFSDKEFAHPEVFDIHDLSIFSKLDRSQVIERLQRFILSYADWSDIERENTIGGKYDKIENEILGSINYNLERLFANLKLLAREDVYSTFQITNTAMLVQIILSNDPAFGGNEKELDETIAELKDTDFDSLDFFRNYDYKRLSFGKPAYRPFQLAFFLLNLESIVEEQSTARNEVVDMLWFPTGGGKTEAYLAVAAFTIIWRRMKFPDRCNGTGVIMRYTLRLLTAQQFERASRLIVALEFLREKGIGKLGNQPISIGLWVGMASTPNSISDTVEKVKSINEEITKRNNTGNPESKNVFQISACPWCGTKLISKNEQGNWLSGFEMYNRSRRFKIRCNNDQCHFHQELPIQVVDEELYNHPPTLLFATVDKFAMLAWEENGHRFFNSQCNDLPPDLIIQDELHLLSGPLGSITGLYESVIEWCCTDGNRKPKIIASTATTRNTDEQVRQLYGGRKVNVFPPSGLSYEDSFFAKTATTSKRRYIGFMPTGKTAIDTQMQLLAHLSFARLEVFLEANGLESEKTHYEVIDRYWTLVSYYNSLKDVGRTHNKVGDEITNFTAALQNRMLGSDNELDFNFRHLTVGTEELTSRISSPDIKKALKRLEDWRFTSESLTKHDKGYLSLKQIIDLVLATNMISVGIDIERLNIMLVNGQPRNIAEYIQASSRVGRSHPGLVVSLLDANRARDKSHFEHFIPFHQAFYKGVEPLSLTPFTESTLNKMLTTLAVAYVRVMEKGMAAQNAAKDFSKEKLNGFRKRIKERFASEEYLLKLLDEKLDELANNWLLAVKQDGIENYKKWGTNAGLLKRPAQAERQSDDIWLTMQSMREIDTSTYLHINLPMKRNEDS